MYSAGKRCASLLPILCTATDGVPWGKTSFRGAVEGAAADVPVVNVEQSATSF